MILLKPYRIFFSILFVCAGIFLIQTQASFSSQSNKVHFIQLNDDTINPVTAEYIVESIDRAYEEKAQCLVIKIDTPGGLLSSTRTIVKKILTSKVPVVVYISPSGSRAGSAGVFITYASHVAAMAPSTNIGAAHPVQMGGGGSPPGRGNEWQDLKELIEELREDRDRKKSSDKDSKESKEQKNEKEKEETQIVSDTDPMSSKILQDTVAFIKAIAQKRNRNVEWAIDSVVKSSSITDEEALEKGVVELIAKSDQDLLEQLNGRTVHIDEKEIVLKTKNASMVYIGMDASQKFFNVLANPNVAYFLMILGFYGLLFEITHPGIGVPGIIGAIFLILAFYSMQMLPTNYAGLALMALGLILLVAEAYTPAFGLLTLGGLVCLVLGSMLLFESADPVMRVSKVLIFTFAATTGGITLFALTYLLKNRSKQALGGQEGLMGAVGEAQANIHKNKTGRIFIHSEIWSAVSEQDLKKGDQVKVTGINGMILKIKKF